MVAPPWLWDFIIIVVGIAVILLVSNFTVKLVEWYIGSQCKKLRTDDEIKADKKTEESKEDKCRRNRIGFIIGRCENILILTFILLNEFTALMIIIGVKGLVRGKDIEKRPGYYLVGTLVNVTISILLSILVRFLLIRFGIVFT
ncbi:MAG: hypothetical protein ACXAAM_08145 [Candidatus Heimdallarchaeaceae archaeon]|jgi:hypothetical protein